VATTGGDPGPRGSWDDVSPGGVARNHAGLRRVGGWRCGRGGGSVSSIGMAPNPRNGSHGRTASGRCAVGVGAGMGYPMSARKTRTTPATAPVATITRPATRGDWFAIAPLSAFDTDDGNDASGAFVTVIGDGADATVRVRFGGRGGAIIAATPDADRAALVVASVRAMRNVPDTYRNDARPGAIPSTVVAIATGTARNIADGATVRNTFGRIPASRRVARTADVFHAASDAFGTPDAFATPDDGDVTPDA